MSTLTSRITRLRPAPTEVALAHLPADAAVRVEFGGRVRDHGPLFAGEPLVLTFAGEDLPWGCRVCEYGSLRLVRNGRHQLDRDLWDEAVKGVTGYGVAYVRFEQQFYFNRQRWTAADLRFDEPSTLGPTPVLWRDPNNPAERLMDAYDEAGYWEEQQT